MASKPAEYTAFLPNSLLTAVNSKAFIPFILASDPSDGVSLAAIAASQHQRHSELLALPASTTLAQALAFFRQWDITAVPVIAEGRMKKGRKFSPSDVVGVFTMQDLIRPLVCHPIFDRAPPSLLPHLRPSTPPTTTPPPPPPSTDSPLSDSDFAAQLPQLDVWQQRVDGFLSCNSTDRSSWFLLGSHTVGDAAKALSSGLRHVLVTEGDDIASTSPVIIHMLSAGDLARFVYTSLPQDTSEHSTLPLPLSQLLSSPVSAHVATKPIVSFAERDLTISAFRRLASGSSSSSSPSSTPSSASPSSMLGAVPIVNSSGMVIDNLSATDLRLLTPPTFQHILDPLSSFLRTLRSAPSSTASSPQSSSQGRSLRPAFAATVGLDVSMQTLMEKMVNLGVSRVWVVDGEAKAVGVVALSDLFRMIVALKLHDQHHAQPHDPLQAHRR